MNNWMKILKRKIRKKIKQEKTSKKYNPILKNNHVKVTFSINEELQKI